MMSKTYCIIGSGVAAVNAAKAIRDNDKEGKILIFSAEFSMPYNRIKLSKELYSDLSSPKVLIKKEKWYETHQIQIINDEVVKINVKNRAIDTANRERYQYDRLLICTGSKNRSLPISGVEKAGVYTIREMHEAEEFKAYIADKNHIVNVGGGIQGLETAWSLHQAGKQVTIIEAAPRLMARQLDEKASERLKAKIEALGIHVLTKAGVNEVIGKDSVEAILAGDETIPCDSVVYSIGVMPNLELVEGTEIQTNRGIIVDDYMETNIAGVFAAGDVTEWNGEVAGLWGRAMDQGKVAGANMAGTRVSAYEPSTPVTVFNAFETPLFSIGMVDEKLSDVTIVEELGNEQYTRLFIKDHKLVGVISFEGAAASVGYKTAIEAGVSLEGIDFTKITIKDLMNEVKERIKTAA